MIRYERYTPWTEPGPYRASDFRRYDGEQPCELLFGRFVMSPAPSNRHQTLVMLLSEILLRAARRGGGRAFVGPADVVLADDTVVQPDLFFVRADRASIVAVEETRGAPDIVVEVLSPGTARRDRVEKLELYARAGVREYWIADSGDRVVLFLILGDDGSYRVARTAGDAYRSARCPEVTVDIPSLWAEFERLAPAQ